MDEGKSQVWMCRATTGMGNTIGNACLIVRNFIQNLFPRDFFKDVFIDTQMIQTEMSAEEITKKQKPCLVIRPKVSLDDDGYFGRLPDWMNTNYFNYRKMRNGGYAPILKDDENQIYMYCIGDRIKINFEVEIILESKLKQLNTAFFLKNSVLHKSYFYINDQKLEAEIPKYFIRQLALILNLDISNPEDRAELNQYLNQHSQHFVEEKIKLGSGNYNHFYRYACNLLSIFENNPDIDDGESQGMLLNNFKISDAFSVEFWSPTVFFVEIGRKFTKIDPKDFNYIEMDGNMVSVHYTITFPLPETYPPDMSFISKTMYITDEDAVDVDTVDISGLFKKDEKKIIAYSLAKKLIPIDELFHIDVYLDNHKVDDEHLVIDWEKLELQNIHPKVNDCYTLVLYKSGPKYNRLMSMMDHIEGKIYN